MEIRDTSVKPGQGKSVWRCLLNTWKMLVAGSAALHCHSFHGGNTRMLYSNARFCISVDFHPHISKRYSHTVCLVQAVGNGDGPKNFADVWATFCWAMPSKVVPPANLSLKHFVFLCSEQTATDRNQDKMQTCF